MARRLRHLGQCSDDFGREGIVEKRALEVDQTAAGRGDRELQHDGEAVGLQVVGKRARHDRARNFLVTLFYDNLKKSSQDWGYGAVRRV